MNKTIIEDEEKEKLIIKYLSMSYSFDTAKHLADEELGLLEEETIEEKREKLIAKYLYEGSNLSTAKELADSQIKFDEKNE